MFVKTYLPELRNVPAEYIHEPHLWDDFKKLDYPEPIIDIKSSNTKAKDILWKIKGNIPKVRKEKIVKKHASRVFRTRKIPKSQKQNNPSIQISLFE